MQAALDKGRPPPDWYLEQPRLLPGDEIYFDAFWNLMTTRAIGMSAGPIPWNHIMDYARHLGLTGPLAGLFVRVIRAMDDAWHTWEHKRIDSENRARGL